MQDPLITICSIQNLLQVALTSKLKLNFDLKVDDSTTKIVSVIYSFFKERKYSSSRASIKWHYFDSLYDSLSSIIFQAQPML